MSGYKGGQQNQQQQPQQQGYQVPDRPQNTYASGTAPRRAPRMSPATAGQGYTPQPQPSQQTQQQPRRIKFAPVPAPPQVNVNYPRTAPQQPSVLPRTPPPAPQPVPTPMPQPGTPGGQGRPDKIPAQRTMIPGPGKETKTDDPFADYTPEQQEERLKYEREHPEEFVRHLQYQTAEPGADTTTWQADQQQFTPEEAPPQENWQENASSSESQRNVQPLT